MAQQRADAIVVGMGPGGEHVAGRLAEEGLDAVGIDERLVGGECPYWGCIPTKMMVRAAHLLAEARRIPGMGGQSSVEPDWAPVADRIRREATDDWDDAVAVERFEKKGGRFVRGRGRLISRDTVEVDGTRFQASKAIVVATGTRPVAPPIPGLDEAGYWTNREAAEAKELPSSLVVLGGGAVGVELSQALGRFGVDVTVVEAAPRLLPTEEPEAGEVLAGVLRSEGMKVHVGAMARAVRRDGAQHVAVELSDGETVRGEQLLVVTGRCADLPALGAGAIGVPDDALFLPVDGRMQVTDGVWAVGDVTGKGGFTHVAMYQADIAVADILDRDVAFADYRALPRVTFTDPEIGSIGLSEAAARQQGLQVRVGRTEGPSSARGWIHKAGNEGFVKLVEDADRGVLVGATSAGPSGGEVLGLLTLAIHAQVPLAVLRRMIFAYPTFHRAVEDALRDLDGR